MGTFNKDAECNKNKRGTGYRVTNIIRVPNTSKKNSEFDFRFHISKKHRKIEAERNVEIILNEILRGLSESRRGPNICECAISENDESPNDRIPTNKSKSMSSLITWNISKALELNPCMDLKLSMIKTQQRLESESSDLNAVLAQQPEQQHLVCALLAWQQLGHKHADSLCTFIESRRNETPTQCCSKWKSTPIHKNKQTTSHCCRESSGSFGSHSSGPVVKLPVETKIIMRIDRPPPYRQKKCGRASDVICNKIDAACCFETECLDRLATLDATIQDLRSRASKLAKREAERVELLERAEAAWKDLELGYDRRLTVAKEKEEDINRQTQKLISDRNGYKKDFSDLSVQFKDRGDTMDTLKAKLTEVEKQVCDRACIKLRLSEECAKGEALLAEHQCRAAQLDRDLQFKEEQARRKLMSLQNEANTARALTYEADRAMRSELSGLREQISEVSQQLFEQDELNVGLKSEHEELRKEKFALLEDLDACKLMCDSRMSGLIEKLKQMKEALNKVKDHAMECQCKIPVDETVEAKRTPSLAALCRCAPEDRLLESCSCTSLRGRLLSNLLADLFGGLHTELNGSGSQMPCQLLKCLEDQHNWDRASVVKTNLRNFFSKLLIEELDIAIATAIENYHAKWVGTSCADAAKMKPDPDDDLSQGWQQRALEKRAAKLASQLAEQLFEERAVELAKRAKAIVRSGPPPCTCHLTCTEAAAYSCLVETNVPNGGGSPIENTVDTTSSCWKRTSHDVTQLRLQIEDLKKKSIRRADLKHMEDKIAKLVKQTSGTENEGVSFSAKETSNHHGEYPKKASRQSKASSIDESSRNTNHMKSVHSRKRAIDNNIIKSSHLNGKPNKINKRPGHDQLYSVNLCLCGQQKSGKHEQNTNNDVKTSWKQRHSSNIIPQSSSVRQTKPINLNLPDLYSNENESKSSAQPSCTSNCKCFHKPPSNTSIDKLLETLTKWKCDLADSQEKCIKHTKTNLSKYCKNVIKDTMCINSQNDSIIHLSISTVNQKEKVNENNIYRPTNKEIVNKTRSGHYKQPIATESEYMGAVNLDKSNEDNCKCIKKIEYANENILNKNKNNNFVFKCINSNACECKIYQEMHKDHKKSQTEKHKVEVANQFQGVPSKKSIDQNIVNSSKRHANNRKGQKSDDNNVTQKTELFPNNCDYYIKFLGVTLADLNVQKETKTIKGSHPNTNDLFIPRDKSIERHKKRQKKLYSMEPTDCYTKPNVYTLGVDHSKSSVKTTKCECNARIDEFKSFMTNIFTNQLQENTITCKDEGLDSQSFKHSVSTIEQCVCCNSYTADDSKDLELNAFHLLEDHLKGKLEEFKLFSCKSACIPPEEEEKLFSAILQRVKQVISDSANEIKYSCPGKCMPTDGSWNRAYGLLQEYLKIKINRVQCLCVLNNNKDVVLPEILDKVCNLIETDFQRLKDICKCKSSNETRKIDLRVEVPERDINTCRPKNEQVAVQPFPELLSKQNSITSMIFKENISSQVSSNLGMDTKSCDNMQLDNKNAQTTETDIIITDSKSNGVTYDTCDCSCNSKGTDNMFGTKEVLVNVCIDAHRDTKVISELTENADNKTLPRCLSVHKFDKIDILPDKEIKESDKINLDGDEQVIKEQIYSVPYIGCTIDCSCDRNLGPCMCTKSIVQANNNKIDTIWKNILNKNFNCKQDFSYIMHGIKKKCDSTITISGKVINSETPEPEISNDRQTCDTEVSVKTNEEEIVLKQSAAHLNTSHHTTNTFDENISLSTSCSNSESPLDWFECSVPEYRASTVKLTNSIYFPVPINDYKKTLTGHTTTETDASKEPQACECDSVPLCHVKMLVENIEKNLLQSKCTCDSMVSKVCPVHSRKRV